MGALELTRNPRTGSLETPAFSSVDRDDEELLVRYRDQPTDEVFSELVRRHDSALRRHVLRYVGSPDQADDVMQAVWLRVHDRRALFRDQGRARPWLHAIAANLALDALRQRARERPRMRGRSVPGIARAWDDLPSVEADPSARLIERERRAWLEAAVARLPSGLRSTVEQFYGQGRTLASIAEAEGVAEGTVKWRLHGALRRLRAWARRSEFWPLDARGEKRPSATLDS